MPLFAPILTGLTALAAGRSLFRGKSNEQQILNNFTGLTSFRSPLGTLRVRGGSAVYRPGFNRLQKRANRLEDRRIYQTLRSMPQKFDINSYYENPFYKSTLSMLSRPLEQQRTRDLRELNNDLNARNQLGSSYDAYRRNLFDERYDNLFADAREQARSVSAQAYQQQFGNALAAIAGLRNDRNAALDAAYTPASLALQAQRNISQVQQAQAGLASGFQMNRTDWTRAMFANLLDRLSGFANTSTG